MPAEPKVYTRLTRNAAGLAAYSSLWLARDHLLIVSNTGYNETYARIMLSDIKAFFITATERHLWWAVPWALLGAISGVRMTFLLVTGATPIGSAVGFGIAAVALVINALWGRGCRVYVMTGVQNTVLPALVRRKKTQAILAQVQPLIVAAQANRNAPGAEAPSSTGPTMSAPLPPADAPPSSGTQSSA